MPNLYVTEPGSRVEREYNRILVSKGGDVLLDVPALKVSQVVLVGQVGVTTPALRMLLERDIDLVMLSASGEFQGRLIGDRHSNTNLKRAQYRRAEEPDFCLKVIQAVVWGKLWNSRVRCLRIAAATSNQVAQKSAQRLHDLLAELPQSQAIAGVRAIEAQGSRAYFSALRAHLRPEWKFPSRQRRPPPDPVNALLSVTYTLLSEAVYSAALLAGLDPYCGFYHAERWGCPALVLDLMEEFRPLIMCAPTQRPPPLREIEPGPWVVDNHQVSLERVSETGWETSPISPGCQLGVFQLALVPRSECWFRASPARSLHAALLRRLELAAPQLSQALHDAPRGVVAVDRPWTISSLSGPLERDVPHLAAVPGNTYTVRITCLVPELIDALAAVFNPGTPLGQEPLELESIYFDVLHQRCRLESLTRYASLLSRAKPRRRIRLAFQSPTGFRSNRQDNAVPSPRRCLEGYLRKWNAFAGVPLPVGVGDLLGYVEEHIKVVDSKLRPTQVSFGGFYEKGVVGEVRWEADGGPPALLRLVNALVDYAYYCGTGVKAAQGMGQTVRA